MKKTAVFLLIALLIFACTKKKNDELFELNFAELKSISCGSDGNAMIMCPAPAQFSTESYNLINENRFLDAATNPLSTFSIDVDAASYSNVRRFIDNSQAPPVDAVRIEELINYFTYDYPQPEGEHPFSVISEVSVCPWNTAHKLVHIGLQGKNIPDGDLPPSNLVFLLDVSGSMNSPNKLSLLKKAFGLLVEKLREDDKVAIVVYAGAAGLVLPSTKGENKEKILEAIENLHAGGSTAGATGIKLAYKVARDNFIKGGNNRVILATDGDFNIGVSSDAELVRMIEKKRESGIYLSVLGFGMGNLKDSKMELLADKGNGNYNYIDNLLEAKKVLVSEFGGTLFTIANDVKIQVEFNPVNVGAYRLIGYENRQLAKEDFVDDTKDAGEMGSGHSVTVLYEIVPAGIESDAFKVDSLKYQTTGIKPDALDSPEMLTLKIRYKYPDVETSNLLSIPVLDKAMSLAETSDNFRFSAAVASFGMLLRDSEFMGNSTSNSVFDLAKAARGLDKQGYRSEFVRLVEAYDLLLQSQIEEVSIN